VADLRNGDFLSGKQLRKTGEDARNIEISGMLAILPISFADVKTGFLTKLFDGNRAVLALEGSRHFRPPSALGEMRYEGCQIAVFKDHLAGPDSLIQRNSNLAVRKEDMEAHSVTVFEEKMEEDVWTLFVVVPLPNVLMICTNGDYTRQVLARMKVHSGDRALPATLPEWQYVNSHATFWAIRHFDKSQADHDPTSPLGRHYDPRDPAGKQAIGVVFNFDPGVSGRATVTILSKDRGLFEKPRSEEQNPEMKPLQIRYREIAPGVVERSYLVAGAESRGYFLFVLMGMLGHAIYL